MKDRMLLIWYWFEVKYAQLLCLFGVRRSALPIPEGMYCYEYDDERNATKAADDYGYYIKPCKYYRSTGITKGVACTYVGYFGFDPCLYDQCKMCSENLGLNDE